jgi:hypothetical protein
MKNLHTSILDTLLNYLTPKEAERITWDVLEFGLADLTYNLVDQLQDYFKLAIAEKIMYEAILNIKK